MTTQARWRDVRARSTELRDLSVVQELTQRLTDLRFVSTVTTIGATLLLSALPLMILMSSFANQDIDKELADHLGLSSAAAAIVEQLFNESPSRPVSAVVVAVLIGFAGTLGVAGLVQVVYEQAFRQPHLRRGNLRRQLLWLAGLTAWLVLDGMTGAALRGVPASWLLDRLALLVITAAFFWWSMRVLLAGRVAWSRLWAPAVATSAMWIGLEAFAAVYFSSAITSDSRVYGMVGVVFSLLTWFIAIAVVIVLGAVVGDMIDRRRVTRPVSPARPGG